MRAGDRGTPVGYNEAILADGRYRFVKLVTILERDPVRRTTTTQEAAHE
jgi:hypothetical protein